MLVGREAEQRLLERLVAGARVGRSSALVVTGEAGIGKTALLDHAVQLSSGMNVLRAAGNRSESDVAFAGLSQLLRPALGLLDAIPQPQADALGIALALRAGTAGSRFAVGAACLSLIARYAEDRPVLLVIDDAHELDQPSAEALAFVARRLMADCVALLFAARSDVATPLGSAGLPELPLPGLPIHDAEQLLAARAGGAVRTDQLIRLHDATGGNPLALLELAGEAKRWERSSPQLPLPVTDTVARLFDRRVAQLDDAARLALLCAALTEGDLSLAAKACARLSVDPASLALAEEVGLVHVGPGRVDFRHPLVRSAVYATASAADRREVHRAVAATFLPGDVERRAWHLAEATIGPDDAVAAQLDAVAERATTRGAYAVAATAYERAAALTAQPEDDAAQPEDDAARAEGVRLVAAARCAWLAGQKDRAEELLGRAIRTSPPPRLLAQAHELRGVIAARTGALDDARRLLVSAAAETAAWDPDTALLLLAEALDVCFVAGNARAGQELVATADRLLTSSRSPLARALAGIATGMAEVLAGGHGIDRIRRAVAEASLDEIGQDPLRRGWVLLGPLFLRESGTGRDLVRRMLDRQREHTAFGNLPFLLFHKARDDATRDQWASAEADYEEAVRLARETGQTTDLVMSLAGLAWLQARLGRAKACLANVAEVDELAARHQANLGTVWVSYARGELALGSGDAAAAVTQFQRLEDLLARLGIRDIDLSPAPELVDALLRAGRGNDAIPIAAAYRQRAAAKGQPWALARAARATGAVGPAESLDATFAEALRYHEATDDVFELARTRLAYGVRLRRARRRVDARPQLRAALRDFDRLGAKPWADFAAAELAATGEAAYRHGDDRRGLLTPQEMQIALRLADRQTTKQVAAALFLSPKTVEYHLRSIYNKLGVNSREKLGVLLRPID
jgi:DNA-binding CsgD family transcriptional regulator